jgi:signal transduction histidine kinase
MIMNSLKAWFKPYWQGPRLLQLFVYVIVFMILMIFIVNYPVYLAGWRFFGSVLALVALLVLNITFSTPLPGVSSSIRRIQDWAFLTVSALLVLATVWLSGQPYVGYLLSITCAQASFRFGVWPTGLLFSAANLIAWLVFQIALGGTFWGIFSSETSLSASVIFTLLVMILLERFARQTSRAEALLKELQAANTALEAAHQKEKELAIAEERVRLARDIHDGLGHHLTVLSIQLQAAGKLVERNPQAAAEAIQACRSEAQAALEEVRHSVSFMRQSPAESQPLPEALSTLVSTFEKRTGLPARFELTGSPVELSFFAWQTIYRAVQEGLTNVQKHALNVRLISVCLAFEPKTVRLLVADDGQAPAVEAPTGQQGFGLAGLHERVSQLGGVFHSGPGQTGGFEIEISIPLQGSDHDPGAAG